MKKKIPMGWTALREMQGNASLIRECRKIQKAAKPRKAAPEVEEIPVEKIHPIPIRARRVRILQPSTMPVFAAAR